MIVQDVLASMLHTKTAQFPHRSSETNYTVLLHFRLARLTLTTVQCTIDEDLGRGMR